MLRRLFPIAVRAPISLLAALLLVRFADEWVTFLPAGSIEAIRGDLDLSYAQAGIVLSALPAGGLLGHALKVAADYVDRRLLAGFGALIQAACLAAFGLVDSFPLLVAASFVWGASTDALVAGCEITLVDLYQDQLAPALARVNALASVGDLLGPLTLAGATAIGIGWRPVFLAMAVLMALYGCWILSQRFPAPTPRDAEAEERTPLRGVLAVLRDPRIVLLAVIEGLFSLLDEPFWGFSIAYFERVRDLPGGAATAIVAVGVAGGIAGFLIVDSVTERWSTRPILFGSTIAIGLSVAAIVFAPLAPLQAAAAFGFGLAGAVFYSVIQAAILGMRPGQAGTTSAVVSTIGLFGLAYPPLVGAVSDRFGLTTGLGLYVAVPVAMLVLLLGTCAEPRAG